MYKRTKRTGNELARNNNPKLFRQWCLRTVERETGIFKSLVIIKPPLCKFIAPRNVVTC